MRPHIRYRWDSETLTFKEIVPHPLYGLAAWWVADNLSQFWYWFSHGGQVLHSPYLRFPPAPQPVARLECESQITIQMEPESKTEMSTPSAHLRAALEKHEILYNPETNYIDDDWDRVEPAILEAMEAYRVEALAEVEAWINEGIEAVTKLSSAPVIFAVLANIKAKLSALKNSSAGKEK